VENATTKKREVESMTDTQNTSGEQAGGDGDYFAWPMVPPTNLIGIKHALSFIEMELGNLADRLEGITDGEGDRVFVPELEVIEKIGLMLQEAYEDLDPWN